jgi:hypothetical protein
VLLNKLVEIAEVTLEFVRLFDSSFWMKACLVESALGRAHPMNILLRRLANVKFRDGEEVTCPRHLLQLLFDRLTSAENFGVGHLRILSNLAGYQQPEMATTPRTPASNLLHACLLQSPAVTSSLSVALAVIAAVGESAETCPVARRPRKDGRSSAVSGPLAEMGLSAGGSRVVSGSIDWQRTIQVELAEAGEELRWLDYWACLEYVTWMSRFLSSNVVNHCNSLLGSGNVDNTGAEHFSEPLAAIASTLTQLKSVHVFTDLLKAVFISATPVSHTSAIAPSVRSLSYSTSRLYSIHLMLGDAEVLDALATTITNFPVEKTEGLMELGLRTIRAIEDMLVTFPGSTQISRRLVQKRSEAAGRLLVLFGSLVAGEGRKMQSNAGVLLATLVLSRKSEDAVVAERLEKIKSNINMWSLLPADATTDAIESASLAIVGATPESIDEALAAASEVSDSMRSTLGVRVLARCVLQVYNSSSEENIASLNARKLELVEAFLVHVGFGIPTVFRASGEGNDWRTLCLQRTMVAACGGGAAWRSGEGVVFGDVPEAGIPVRG